MICSLRPQNVHLTSTIYGESDDKASFSDEPSGAMPLEVIVGGDSSKHTSASTGSRRSIILDKATVFHKRK